MTLQVRDDQGKLFRLGRELRRGGEGVIHEVQGLQDVVAKLYLRPPDSDKASKLTWMSRHGTPELLRVAAWPMTTLHDEKSSSVVGFTMPRINGFKEVHLLYGLQSRRREFGSSDWAYLVHTAMNTAIAFQTVNEAGHVLGDVNAGNLLVSPKDATVRLIDCDSLQINARGRLFLCEVGVPEYTPPELQGQPFATVTRTENHDAFGLAVLIFQLLFVGRHPFMGRFLGPGDLGLDQAIREFRFAFGSAAPSKQMAAPPFSLALNAVSQDLARLFERAFSPDSAVGPRPTPAEWSLALTGLLRELNTCQNDESHKYYARLGKCPWCSFATSGGPAFFMSVAVGGLDFLCGAADLRALWAEVARITSSLPGPTPTTSQVAASAARAVDAMGTRAGVPPWPLRASLLLLAASGLVLLVFAATWSGPACLLSALAVLGAWSHRLLARRRRARQTRDREREYTEAATALEAIETGARSALAELKAEVATREGELEAARRDYLSLPDGYESERRNLERDKARTQRRDYLESELIEQHEIEKIKGNLKTQLLNFNIETAWDVLEHDLTGIPNVGPARREALLAWAKRLDGAFRFDPTRDVPEADRRALVMRYRQKQSQLRGLMEKVIDGLRREVESSSRAIELSAADLGKARILASERWETFISQ